MASRSEQGARTVQEWRGNIRVLIPVPVRQSEMFVSRQVLADAFEVEKITAMPVKEVIVAVLAPDKSRACGAMDGGDRAPVARIARGEAFHGLYRLLVDRDIVHGVRA